MKTIELPDGAKSFFLLGALDPGKRELSLGMFICIYCPHCNDTKLKNRSCCYTLKAKIVWIVQETCQTLPHE